MVNPRDIAGERKNKNKNKKSVPEIHFAFGWDVKQSTNKGSLLAWPLLAKSDFASLCGTGAKVVVQGWAGRNLHHSSFGGFRVDYFIVVCCQSWL